MEDTIRDMMMVRDAMGGDDDDDADQTVSDLIQLIALVLY